MRSDVDIDKVRRDAEEYYRSGDYYCSEAVVRVIRDEFELPAGDEVIRAASGFPVGIGAAGCLCGAVSGGVMAIGLAYGRSQPADPAVNTAMELSARLHDAFKASRRHTCCRKLTRGMELGSPQHMEQCIAITGEVAAETARLILQKAAEAGA